MAETPGFVAMDRDEWLAQVAEDAIDPDLPICDPHHHLWDYPGSRYLLDELLADVGSGHNVASTVFMECGSMYRAAGPEALKPVGETEFVNGVAAMSASGRLRRRAGLRCHRRLCGPEPRRGGRRSPGRPCCGKSPVPGHPPRGRLGCQRRRAQTRTPRHCRGCLADTTFRAGFAELGKRGMTFDGWLYHPQIPELTDLARAFPDQPIIFDHFGGPLGIGPYEGKRTEIFAYWKDAVADLAQCGNVVAKLGGLVMAINGFGFHKRERPATSDELVAATRDYHLHMIDCFGPDRCMFESNFPVDKVSCGYGVLYNSFKKIAAGFSAAEKAALFHDTAVRVYQVS